GDIRDRTAVDRAMAGADAVVHLAGRAGVRPSFQKTTLYCDVNVTGTAVLLQSAAEAGVPRFVFASSSSVYGDGADTPFREDGGLGTPLSPYAATKLVGEHICHTYRPRIANIAALRLFSVYGPAQRPDLAIHKFAERISAGESIPVLGSLDSFRDYTFVDDIVAGIVAALQTAEPWLVVNLGSGRPITLGDMIAGIETELGLPATKDMLPPAEGDLFGTWADVSRARDVLGYEPSTVFADGVREFIRWFRDASPSAGLAIQPHG
ncbi:MAG: UDP-glucuronate 4-epimerase, partial [bacterium]